MHVTQMTLHRYENPWPKICKSSLIFLIFYISSIVMSSTCNFSIALLLFNSDW